MLENQALEEAQHMGKSLFRKQQQYDSLERNEIDEPAIVHHIYKEYNVILLGESRSGKTTFKRTLADPNHQTEMQVLRGTINPTVEQHLFNIDGEFIGVNIVDTPGFGELAEDECRTDIAIENMIAECAKKDIAHISMILITVDGQAGLTQNKVKMMKQVMRFLGQDLASHVYLLVTHFEGRTQEHETEWMNIFRNTEGIGFLRGAIRGGFIFTGALDSTLFKNVQLRDRYLLEQRRRTREFFEKLRNSSPKLLRSEAILRTQGMLHFSEAMATKCRSLRLLIPDLETLRIDAINERICVSSMLEKSPDERAAKICQEYGWLGNEKEETVLPTQASATYKMDEYTELGKDILTLYGEVLELHNKYTEAKNSLTRLKDELEWGM